MRNKAGGAISLNKKGNRIIGKAAALLCSLMILTGCAGGNSERSDVAVDSIYASVCEAVELPAMIEGDAAYISNYYGIALDDVEEYIVAEAEEPTLATTVIVIKAKDKDAVDRLAASLKTVISQKAAEMQDYIPEQYKIVADSKVKTEGVYLYLVISEQVDKIESVIRSALK